MTTSFENLGTSVKTVLADIDNLSKSDKMEILLALSDDLGYVCLEGYDFDERESFDEGYLAFIHKRRD